MSPGKVVLQAKPYLQSKTIRLGALLIALGILEVAQTMDLPPGWVSLIGVAVIVLRALTTRPVTMSVEPRRVQVAEEVKPPPKLPS